ncbi:hypothetical protein DFR41_1018 [Pseudacidovorax intermedius]|uniref:Uncharacterized protein n=1 Tax=Pseudacidovorax intermedius TaxID=433924 RepID=A0A370FKS0_9BURK|nr:hypothetical protein [Pseudacidovorax intermedius]RDI28256.1 hypothetical protein DFR41_1018 [Pseudacidovorax intermedius]
MKRSLDISIEGDFIHSFLYSGTLFLVGADSVVRTYNWETLISETVGKQLRDSGNVFEVIKFLVDSRYFYDTMRDVVQTLQLVIDAKDLQRSFVGELKLAGWPADIYVYANRFYTADERGVVQTQFSYENKLLDDSRQITLTEDRAYSISPNDFNRVAIAAGPNGIFTAAPPTSGRMRSDDLNQILEIESYDCEWMNQVLVANTASGPHAATFHQIPRVPDEPSYEFWQIYKALRHSGPKVSAKLGRNGNDIVYAWLGVTKLFQVTGDGCLEISQLAASGSEAPSIESLGSNSVHRVVAGGFLDKLFSVRSASFGSVAEAGESLFVLSESGMERVAIKPVSWRVFPRAKNYVNHLHVISDDMLKIYAYLPPENSGKADLFGADAGNSDVQD